MKKKQIFILMALIMITALGIFLYPRMRSISDAKNYSEREFINKYEKK